MSAWCVKTLDLGIDMAEGGNGHHGKHGFLWSFHGDPDLSLPSPSISLSILVCSHHFYQILACLLLSHQGHLNPLCFPSVSALFSSHCPCPVRPWLLTLEETHSCCFIIAQFGEWENVSSVWISTVLFSPTVLQRMFLMSSSTLEAFLIKLIKSLAGCTCKELKKEMFPQSLMTRNLWNL